MAEAYFNGKAGVWRTVGGRRIFIAEGQSLKEAMKASGKFKNLKDNGKESDKNSEINKTNDIGKNIAKNLPYENPAREKAESLKNDYLKYYSDYKKYADKANAAGYGTEEYQKYAAKRSEAYQKAMEAKVEALTEFNKTIPYNEMFDVAKEISGSKNITFGEPKLVKGRDSGSLYTTYQSNDIKADTGVFSSVLKGARLENFNSSLSISEDGELSYWGTMSLRYQHNGGGTNGMEIMEYTYKDKTGWDITDSAGYKYKNGKKITTASGLADYYMEYYGYSKENARIMANARMEELKRRDQDINF